MSDATRPSDIVRTSDTVATLTLPASATYSIDSDEILTWTIPAAVLTTSSSDVVASPTITVTAEQEQTGSGGADKSDQFTFRGQKGLARDDDRVMMLVIREWLRMRGR